MRLVHASWGTWASIRLASAAVEAEVVPELGARVISLRDLRRDREWLLRGTPPTASEARGWSAEGAVFGGRESFGWDECLPTVSVCADPLDPAGGPLRDHGDQWATAAKVVDDDPRDPRWIESSWGSSRWRYDLTRRMSFVADDSLLVEYSLANHAAHPLPLLWSMHPVLPLEPGTLIEITGVDSVRGTWANGISLDEPDRVEWPVARLVGGAALDLSRTRSDAGWAAKLYAMTSHPVAAVRADGARLEFDWDREFAPAVGIWLSCGGWPPSGPPVQQMAIEPTTSPDDDLASALVARRARHIEPGGRLTWWVRLTLSA